MTMLANKAMRDATTVQAAARRRRRHAVCWLAPALLATACGQADDKAADAPPAERSSAAAAPTVATGSWQRLADGSSLRIAGDATAERQEADRCWPAGTGFDCLSVDEINLDTGHVVVVARTRPAALDATQAMPPAQGFSCAIYPKVVEQRLIRADGDPLHNDDTDGSLWSAADVQRLKGDAAGFVDCAALRTAMGGKSAAALLSTPGFARGGVAPGTPS